MVGSRNLFSPPPIVIPLSSTVERPITFRILFFFQQFYAPRADRSRSIYLSIYLSIYCRSSVSSPTVVRGWAGSAYCSADPTQENMRYTYIYVGIRSALGRVAYTGPARQHQLLNACRSCNVGNREALKHLETCRGNRFPVPGLIFFSSCTCVGHVTVRLGSFFVSLLGDRQRELPMRDGWSLRQNGIRQLRNTYRITVVQAFFLAAALVFYASAMTIQPRRYSRQQSVS